MKRAKSHSSADFRCPARRASRHSFYCAQVSSSSSMSGIFIELGISRRAAEQGIPFRQQKKTIASEKQRERSCRSPLLIPPFVYKIHSSRACYVLLRVTQSDTPGARSNIQGFSLVERFFNVIKRFVCVKGARMP